MTDNHGDIMKALTSALEAGTLTVDELRRGIAELLSDHHKRQDLLYLQAKNSSLEGDVIGMMLIEDGELDEGPLDPADWPVQDRAGGGTRWLAHHQFSEHDLINGGPR